MHGKMGWPGRHQQFLVLDMRVKRIVKQARKPQPRLGSRPALDAAYHTEQLVGQLSPNDKPSICRLQQILRKVLNMSSGEGIW
jgi:hypothetical protein